MNRVFIILIVAFTITLLMAALLVALLGSGGAGGSAVHPMVWWTLLGGILFILAVTVLMGMLLKSISASRARRSLGAQVRSRGFDFAERGDPVLVRPILAAPRVRDGARLANIVNGTVTGRPFIAFQQSHDLSFGHGSIPIHSTILSVTGFTWPIVWIEPVSRWQRTWRRRVTGRRDDELPFEHEPFRTGFRVTSEDEDFCIVLLSPEVQAFLAEDPTIAWYLIAGRLVVHTAGPLDIIRLDALLERVERFLEFVPDELEYWGAPPIMK